MTSKKDASLGMSVGTARLAKNGIAQGRDISRFYRNVDQSMNW